MAGTGTGNRSARLLAAARAAPVSTALAATNVAVFGVTFALGALGDEAVLLRAGALERSHVWAGQPWRLLTAAFLHVGPIHLACNVFFGWTVCRVVERAAGGGRLLGLYLSSALGGSALSLLGQDGVSAGASGALFGMVGTVLALHLRALGGLRPFLASPATRWLAGGAVVTAALGPLGVPLDHLAHLGGLVTGATGAWLLSRPSPARSTRWALAVATAALAALALAAAWPRPGLTRWQVTDLEARLHVALSARETGVARALADRAAGVASDRLAYYRALLLVQEGDLERALEAARPLRSARDGALRAEGGRLVASIARTLAYRSVTGDGAPRNPWRGLAYLEEACGAGDAESCRSVERLSTGAPRPP